MWREDSIEWRLDDIRYFQLHRADFPTSQPWVFDHDFFLLLNLAVGGNFVKSVPDSLTFPRSVFVDYVRVYDLAEGSL